MNSSIMTTISASATATTTTTTTLATMMISRHGPEAAVTATIIVVRLVLVILICVLLVKLILPNNNDNYYDSNYYKGISKRKRRARTRSGSIVFVSQHEYDNGGDADSLIRPEVGPHHHATSEGLGEHSTRVSYDDDELVNYANQTKQQSQDSDYYSDTSSNKDGSTTPTKSDTFSERITLFDSRLFSNLISRYSSARQILTRPQQQQHSHLIQSHRRKSQPELSRCNSAGTINAASASSYSSSSFGMNKNDTTYLETNNYGERRRRHSDTSLAHLKLPPGPMGLPFLGYLPFVGHEIHLTLTSLSERYGPIYQIFLGGIRVVVLNDASLVRHAFKQPVFSGRPDTQLTRILQGYGIVNSDGALWKEQRAFLHSALRRLGAKSLMSGSNGLEAKIQNQVKEFVNDLSSHASEGTPCQVRPMVARAVSSVVGSIVMNLTYRKYEEKEKFDRLIELMQEGFRLFTIAMPLDFIPIFRFLPGVSYAYKKMKKNRAETSAFFKGVADEHRKYLRETFNLGTSSSASSLHPRNQTSTLPAYGASTSSSSSSSPSSPSSSTSTFSAFHPPSSTTPSQPLSSSSLSQISNSESSSSSSSGYSSQNSSSGVEVVPVAPASSSKSEEEDAGITVTGRQSASLRSVGTTTPLTLSDVTTGKLANEGQSDARYLASKSEQSSEQKQDQQQQGLPSSPQVACQSNNLDQQQQQQQQVPEPRQQQPRSQTVELESIVPRDLVDAYIMQQIRHEKDGKENYFSDQQLVQIMSDIFSAGLETVTSTIEWSILFLILNTECQEQIQIEIDRIIGRERMPQLEDLAQMPYTEATIYEVLRRSNVIALGNAHATLADASIGGFLIPKGTQVLPNLYGIHMNPKLWTEPEKFDPSRFILNDKAYKPDYFIPFSVGRRMCLGDVLAKMEVFLFLVGLLQKYDLSVADEDRLCPPEVKGTLGVSNTPASFRVSIKCRPK